MLAAIGDAGEGEVPTNKLLEVRDLQVSFGEAPAVRGVSFHIDAGETVALVGESGSGKSVTALSVLQLLPYPPARHPGGSVLVNGEEMIGASKARLLDVRGGTVSMIFQEPMTSLNPLHTIAKQVGEALVVHKRLSPVDARTRTLELLDLWSACRTPRNASALIRTSFPAASGSG